MLNTPDNIKTLYETGSTRKTLFIDIFKTRQDYFDNNKITTISNDNFVSESMSLTESVCESDTLKFGNVVSSQFEIDVLENIYIKINDTDSYKLRLDDKYISVYMKIGNEYDEQGNVIPEYEYNLPLFHGRITESKLSETRLERHIVAHDDIFDVLDTNCKDWFTKWLEKSKNKTLKGLRKDLLNYFNVDYIETNLINDNMPVLTFGWDKDITARELLHDICEINSCFGIINRDNLFEYRLINISEFLYPDDTVFPRYNLLPGYSLKKQENIYNVKFYDKVIFGEATTAPLNQLVIYYDDKNKYQEINDKYVYPKNILFPGMPVQDDNLYPGKITDTLNQYVIEKNIFYEQISGELSWIYMTNCFSAMRKINYTPFETLDTFGLPFLEVGDIVTVDVYESNLTTKKYFPLLTRTLKGIQGLKDSLKARGKEYIDKENYI